MSRTAKQPSDWRGFGLCALILVLVLGFLFRSGLPADRTVFANDGPLGLISSDWAALPEAFRGVWQDSNWLGLPGGFAQANLNGLLASILSPLLYSKFFAISTLLVIGLCAWICFRQWKFAPAVCVIGALGVALNSDFVGTSCWGVGTQTICFGMNFLALAALADVKSSHRWIRAGLAGFAVGLGVTEGFDIGALFSLVVAAFVVYQSWASEGSLPVRLCQGVGRLALVGGCALFIAAATVFMLLGTSIKGVVGMEQDAETKARRWDQATQWSLPKIETLGTMIPGLFGFRMDTPATLPESLRKSYEGGAYWGIAGRDPAWERYLEAGRQGPMPRGFLRYGGGGGYAGQLVLILAAFAVIQSFRGRDSVYSALERKLIWFWFGVLVVSLLFAFGRFAPFYQFFYALPYASTIRNPAKFGHIFAWAQVILFGFGLHGLWKRCGDSVIATGRGLVAHWQSWWPKAATFDRRWVIGSAVFAGIAILGWFLYAQNRSALETYLADMHGLEALSRGGKPDGTESADYARATASFSIGQVREFLLLLLPSLALVCVVLSGYFTGARAKIAACLLGGLLALDLAHSNVPWVITYNWKEKYLQAGDNPVIEFLRQRPYEHRVAIAGEFLPQQHGLLAGVYGTEWTQHLFQFNNIQTIDIVQMPRPPVEVEKWEQALFWDRSSFDRLTNTIHHVLRKWELTNVRYLVGSVGMAEGLNREIDPRKRFRQLMAFEFYQSRADGPILTRTNATGPFALIEFTGALPRASLYGAWQVNTNDADVLNQLTARDFDPAASVFVAEPITPAIATNANAGTVEYVNYAPTRINLKAKAAVESVLLLNDKHDAAWKVFVDGKPARLLRCNFVMRGVQLSPGDHTVEFRYEPDQPMRFVTVAAIVLMFLLVAYVGLKRPNTPP